jgi:hypothetical protein
MNRTRGDNVTGPVAEETEPFLAAEQAGRRLIGRILSDPPVSANTDRPNYPFQSEGLRIQRANSRSFSFFDRAGRRRVGICDR